ncbi:MULTISPECIES: ABC transporter substrate-binding protein [Nocardioides]|uniref:ABC-type branched-chain amino acid transport system, substrate-binding protein n=1 Tax=Nocardioides lianchengensis TaxID=1045774 RepID=A0A1G6ZV40_9ACTN|nr:ABC transporter substrate-binding protein [Nocardioides lianchengensis]NYG12239.1 hypothetical protein [Nocardioides lianchengensis]SDE06422.1 ABC-type branched-chain amino acid transport system, substrate-binding protein [Nocardioides lianchengensis]
MRHQRLVRAGAAAASILLLVPACSSDRDSADPGGDDSSAAPKAELPTDTFGDLESPCGEGDASGATEQGVTDDSITIGYGDDKGFSATPGLNQEMGDAMDAFIQWCNGLGGINGREIVGNRYDAAIFNTAQVMKESCSQDFMLVGQGFGLDENAEPDRIKCKMPTVSGFTISPAASMGPMHYQAVPGPVDEFNPSTQQILMDNYPEFAKTGMVNSDSPAVAQGLLRYFGNFEAVGADADDCGVSLKSAGGDNYRAIVQKYKECGVTALFSFTPPSPPLYSFLEAAKVEGLDLTFATEATWYNEAVSDANVGDLTEGVKVGMQFQPFENADEVPAVADYLSIMDEFGGVKALLGMQTASSFLLWAQVAKDCGSDLTRQCMVDGLSKVTSWTGGGLHAESNPGDNRTPICGILTEVKGKTYEQIVPEAKGEYFCVDKARPGTEAELGGIELTDDRIATKYLTDDVLTPSS